MQISLTTDKVVTAIPGECPICIPFRLLV
jgi:hypothetical protein